MKRFIGLVGILAIVMCAVLLRQAALADDATPMTEAHIARIRSNCVEAQSSLNQLHASDALLRVNRGQLYESISTKLMAPFNSRVALNKLDGTDLVSLAAKYENELSDFRQAYQQYEEAMSKTLYINCTNQPVAFYDSVTDTRAKRKVVHDATLSLQKTIQDYKDAFEDFAKKYEGNRS